LEKKEGDPTYVNSEPGPDIRQRNSDELEEEKVSYSFLEIEIGLDKGVQFRGKGNCNGRLLVSSKSLGTS
jgi:hypothetical protein